RLAIMKREAIRELGQGHAAAGDRAGLMHQLDRALEEMWMAFQPIVTGDGATKAYEALLRSDDGALPTPMAVLDAAERRARTTEVGRRSRRLAATAFTKHAPADALLFVNLLPSDLLDPELATKQSPLGSIASRVVLEITERATLQRVTDVAARVDLLRY